MEMYTCKIINENDLKVKTYTTQLHETIYHNVKLTHIPTGYKSSVSSIVNMQTAYNQSLKDLEELIETNGENKHCKHCSDYTEKHGAMKNQNAWISFYEHYMEVVDNRKNGNIISFAIKYCPMCGRNLGNGK